MSTSIEVTNALITEDTTLTLQPPATIDLTNTIVEPCIVPSESLVTGGKKEYSIVGDGIYASVSVDQAPQWLVDIIDVTIGSQLADATLEINSYGTELQTAIANINTAIDAVNVAENEYQQLINIDAKIDSVVASQLTTINATVSNNQATILDLQTTKVDSTQAASIAVQQIDSSLNSGALKTTVDTINTSITTLDSSLGSSITALESQLSDPTTGLATTATAVNALQTYVGIDTAGAYTGTGLSAYINDSTGVIAGADSQVANSVYVDSLGNAKTKWEYVSDLVIDGVYYEAGFGLSLTGTTGTGTELDPFSSEFWINAEKFKFTNSALSGQVAPFAIDASGATPSITFNGIVDFTNTNTSGTTTIDGDKITTGTVTASQIQANSVSADRLTSSTGLSTTWSGGGLVSSDFNGNPYGLIGSPTTGFRLSSNAAGTSTDPTIYGSYIKGGTIEGAEFTGVSMSVGDIKVKAEGFPTNYGPIALDYVGSGIAPLNVVSTEFVARSTGTGFNSNRMCSTSQKFLVEAVGTNSSSTVTTSIDLYVSYNSGASWTLLGSDSQTYYASVLREVVVDGSQPVTFKLSSVSTSISGWLTVRSINGN